MKKRLFNPVAFAIDPPLTATIGCRLFWVLFLVLMTAPAQATDRQPIQHNLPSVVTNTAPLRHSPGWTKLNLAIGLPLRNREGLTNLLRQLYDPASANFHHYLTPNQFTQRFGPTEEDYQAVVHFAQSHGLLVTARHPNRTLVSVRGTVTDIERAFHVTLNEYEHPTEARTFYAPDVEPSIDLTTPVLSVGGLDNYVLPHPCLKQMPVDPAQPALAGSGPTGAYLGNDFRAAYVPGETLTGTGQIVGLLEFNSGFYQSDITAYESLAKLPNVPVNTVLLDGYAGGPGAANDEVSLDIEMAIAMAPGLSEVLVYEGSSPDDVLNRMATDNLAKQIGVSWIYPIDADTQDIFLQFAAQGQSFFNASGDGDARTGTIPTPTDDPNVIVVGGTTLTTTGAAGAWVSETVWNWNDGTGSSGGISTVYPIPSWQQGISMTANQGSTTMRNLPDVAMVANNVWILYTNGGSESVGGTSCAAPLWAAFTALMNQSAVAKGEPTVGFINPAVYAIGKGSNAFAYTNLFHDITTGNNESSNSPTRFKAVPGYDLCTGWGTPTGSNLIAAIGLPEPLQIAPATGALFTGPLGGPFAPAAQTYSLVNGATIELNWVLSDNSSVFNVTPQRGTLLQLGSATNVTVSLALSDTNLAAGSYSASLWFTNLGDGYGQTRLLTLAVVTPPVITAQPSNQQVLDGATATFTVGTSPNALLSYQWLENGTNLSDGGLISGSSTSSLTISNASVTNVATYAVVLSNAAGVLVSSNASLGIVASRPVIVTQPTNQSVLPGAPASFSVAAIGNPPFSYQWQANGTNLANGLIFSGVASNTLTISSASFANAGLYSVVVGNTLGSTTSTGAVLAIIPVTAPGLAIAPLYSFNDDTSGAFPYSPVAEGTDGNFYGTTLEGGTDGEGTIYRVTSNGVLTTVRSFTDNNGEFIYGGLYLGKDGYFYGTSFEGGSYGDGVLFKTTTGGSLTVLASFNQDDGQFPVGGMIQGNDGNFYGTTLEGGAYGYGSVFRTTTAGVLTSLVSFEDADGANPSSVLVQGSDGNYYGTTESGGAYGWGTVFKIAPSGVFTNLYSFTGGEDGGSPVPGVVQAMDGNFYGTTYEEGAYGFGTVFEITSSGELTTRYSFTGGSDGGNPWGGLVQALDGNLYGTTQDYGVYSNGTVFQMAPNGVLATVGQFDGYAGALPSAALFQGTDGNLYGTTEEGGAEGFGAIYRLSFNGPLAITGQPAGQSAYSGATAAFTVATFGGAPVSYQWQQAGLNLTNGGGFSGANAATLVISNATGSDAALYSVVVSNSFNSFTSKAAYLEVIYSTPNIVTQPTSLTCVAGTTASFAVTAVGDQPLSYQWEENGTNLTDGGVIAGSSTSSLTISSVAVSNAGTYSVIVSNPLYAVSSGNAILAVLSATPPGSAATNLHLFGGGLDGAFPYGSLIEVGGELYGTLSGGGADYVGAMFKVTLAGSLDTFYNFGNTPEGANPDANLALGTNGYYYGTASAGGSNNYGAVFRMAPSPNIVTFLYSFKDELDGETPLAGLVQGPGGYFYGTAYEGGANSYGAVFKMPSSGAVTGLYEFTGGDDGGFPYAGLVSGQDGTLYGTTLEFGAGGGGTVFRLTTNGTLTTLAWFEGPNGAFPQAGVVQGTDGNLYGCTAEGGSNDYGTVFRLTINGALTTLYSFGFTDGAYPVAALAQGTDGNFYGTTSSGGAGGQGTAFRISTNGALTTLLWFDGLNGANPEAALFQAGDGNFYGTTAQGGTGFISPAGGGYGGVYRLTVPIFISNSMTLTAALAGLPYSSSLSALAVAPAGDPLSFAKVSGPAWLNVSTNGLVSGVPAASNIGSNAFVVSLTDTNGVTATATLIVPVVQDPPPYFLLNPFSEAWADVDEAYAGNIATNATDSELGQGDSLTFGKLSGPAWLDVATNGGLSGLPEYNNAGSNTFVVSVTNLGGASGTAVLSIYVNSAPAFTPQDFTDPAATVKLPYSGTLATNVTDPDLAAGDFLTFYKVTGPAWLDVATNGALSGLPSSADLGANAFLVLVVDATGLSAVGNLSITVNTAAPIVAGISSQGASLMLSWTGGGAPYQVKMATNLTSSVWQNVAGPLSGTNLILTPSNVDAYYLIQGQ